MHPRPFGRRAPAAVAQTLTMSDVPLAGVRPWDAGGVVDTLFRMKGRFSRKSYRIARLCISAGYVAIYLLVMQVRTVMPAVDPWHLLAVMVTILLVMGLILWCDLVITIKRWHDLDRSAWWALLGVVPVAGWLAQSLMCACKNGTPGVNRYGPAVG